MFYFEKAGALRIFLYVQPKASRHQVVGLHDQSLKIKIQAPPVDGQANIAVIEFLAQLIRVPKTSLALVKGVSSRKKVVEYQGPDMERVKKVLQELV